MIIVVFFYSCASLPESKPIIKRYCVGQGGGFTGEFKEFSFSDNGKVYKRDFVYDRDVYYKDLPPIDLKYFLNQISELGIEYEEINYPGNMTKYIEVRENESSRNKIVWDSRNYTPSSDIVKFFDELYNKLAERP